jgi:hypothetical protein
MLLSKHSIYHSNCITLNNKTGERLLATAPTYLLKINVLALVKVPICGICIGYVFFLVTL